MSITYRQLTLAHLIMSLNKRQSANCRPDHPCCQQLPKLSRQVDILQNKLRNTKQDLQLAERVNAKLVQQLSKQGRSPSPGLVLSTNRTEGETLRTQEDSDELTRIRQEYERRARHMEMQIERINEDAANRVALLNQQRQLEMRAVQDHESQLRNYIRDLESQTRELHQKLQFVDRENGYLAKDKEMERSRASKLENDNKVLEADYLAMKLQMRHMKDALKDMEDNYSNMNNRLLVEQQVSRQALTDRKSKAEELEKAMYTQRKVAEGSDRLRTQNERLRKINDNLDDYAFEQHKKRDQSQRRMHSLYNFDLRRTHTASDLKRSIEKYRNR